MEEKILGISPVMPSQDIGRDVKWYNEFLGFELVSMDSMYAVLKRANQFIHLQWHADTKDDPLLGGSVIKLFVNDIEPWVNEFIERGTITEDRLRMDTDWGTHEFGFYDLNKNAIFIVQDV